MNSINTVTLVGNLTRDPELRATPGGTSVCTLRLAVNESVKGQDGNWSDRANFINVDVFGGQAESCATYLTKGRQVAVSGRLRWREWEGEQGKREAVSVVADRVQFIGPKTEAKAPAPDWADEARAFVAGPQDDDENLPF